jgi:hypothetical protein
VINTTCLLILDPLLGRRKPGRRFVGTELSIPFCC